MSRSLYILYNADGTFMGKLRYGYRKITSSTPEAPACAACDITHGGLSFTEVPAWVDAKKKIESESLNVIQLHRDELGPELKAFVDKEGLKLPTTILWSDDKFKEVLSNKDLVQCCGDAGAFVTKLYEREILKEQPKLS